MLKKALFNPLSGLAAIVVSQWLYVRFVGPSMTPFGVLGALSVSGLLAFVICNVVTAFSYRANGAGGGIKVLATLVVSLGGTIVGFAVVAHAFGASAPLLYVGMGVIAVIAALAMRALS